MQKVFCFEISMAVKDRPKVFQLVTLALFAFSLTIILISSVVRFSGTGKESQAYKPVKPVQYTGFVSARAHQMIDLQK